MCLIHHLSDSLIVRPFKSIADIEHSLNLSDNILRTEEILLRNKFADLFEPNPLGIAEELHVRMVLLDGGAYILAGLASLVVC